MQKVGKKLLNMMSVLKNIPKNGYNSHQKYNYVKDEDLSAAVQAALLDNNCLFYPNLKETVITEVNGKILTTLTFEWIFFDVDSGESIKYDFPGQGIDGGDKGSNKAATGAHKNALIKFFNISTGGQDAEMSEDGDGYNQQRKQQQNKNVKQFPNTQQRQQRQQQPARSSADPLGSISRGSIDNVTEAKIKPKYQQLFGCLDDYDLFVGTAGYNFDRLNSFLDEQLADKSEYFKKILSIYGGDKEKAGRFVRKQLFSYRGFKAILSALEKAASEKGAS